MNRLIEHEHVPDALSLVGQSFDGTMYAQIAAFAIFGAGTIAAVWWAEGGASAGTTHLANHPRVDQQVLKAPGAVAQAECELVRNRVKAWGDDYAGWSWRRSCLEKEVVGRAESPLLVRPISSFPHLDRPTNTAVSRCRPEPATGLTWMAPDLIDLRMLATLFYS